MKQKLKILAAIGFFAGILNNVQAANLVQSLTFSLAAFDRVEGRVVHITTSRMIRYLLGTNVVNGRIQLVTPVGNAPGTLDNLHASLRITSGSRTVYEIPSPSQFNIYQDTATMFTHGSTITSVALNRFSFDTGAVRAELQGIGNWIISTRLSHGHDVSGSGAFSASVNGWITIFDVTQPVVPVSGLIIATPSVFEP